MSETVYIETSFIGYLTIRPSKNPILIANLDITRQWWNNRRSQFILYISQVVVDEISEGDPEMAIERLEIIQGISLLELTDKVQELGEQFLQRSNLPPKAADDAIHIAAATVYGLDYLLTWNCKHIANAQIQRKLRDICFDFGYELPIICTPYEMMGE